METAPSTLVTMAEWVALLRGVNVGGITVRSVDLKALFTDLGFTEVRTVLASGNVVFSAEGDRARLKSGIETALRERFGYDAWIVLVSREEVAAAVAGFPFAASDPGRQPWVIFCSEEAVRRELLDGASDFDPLTDPVAEGDKVIYWNPVTGATTSTTFAKLLAKPRYKATTTNRNLRTLQKIIG